MSRKSKIVTYILAVIIFLGIVEPYNKASAQITNSPYDAFEFRADWLNDEGENKSPEMRLYEILKPFIISVAAGESETTEITIPLSELFDKTIYTRDELGVSEIVANNAIVDESKQVFYSKFEIDSSTLLDKLVFDFPYDLYWFDKGTGSSIQYSYSVGALYDHTKGAYDAFVLNEKSYIKYSFTVDEAYCLNGNANKIDTTKLELEKSIPDIARQVVESAKDLSDYEKLEFYAKYICDSVTYYNEAAKDTYTGDGKPWQIINVFDGDSTTNVVCEGYAKAFQYLFNLSEFSADIKCYLVTGAMTGATGQGRHMWNIVKFANGKNYLVDVTNVDEGTAGDNGFTLFLTGTNDGTVTGTYSFKGNNGSVRYTYDSDTLNYYDLNDLIISDSKYVPVCHHVPEEDLAVLPTCTEAGLTEGLHCSVCGEVLVAQEVVKATGHKILKTVIAPTFTEKGYTICQCVYCDYNYKENYVDMLATTLELTETSLMLVAGDVYQLGVMSNNPDAVINFVSSDESVASVDENGVIIAHKYGNATISATLNELMVSCDISVLFNDVLNSKKYYYKPIYWAADAGITLGYNGVYFGVGENCTRASVMIFLWRLEGSPAPKGDARKYFNDVTKSAKTDTNKAIAWAYENGIAKGYSDGSFGVDKDITRTEVMIMLYRIAGKPSFSGELTFTDCQNYSKRSDTYKAILWGYSNGITKGYDDGSFGATRNCNREDIITFIYRYHNLK